MCHRGSNGTRDGTFTVMPRPGRGHMGRRSRLGAAVCETGSVMAYLILIIAICVVLAVGGGLFFLRPGRRRGGAPPAPPAEAQRPGQGVGGEAGAAAGTIAPEAPLAPPVPPAPEIERPPPSAGRMVRLRARLARSQSAFGSVLLGLLSRDTIDEAAWEEIE